MGNGKVTMIAPTGERMEYSLPHLTDAKEVVATELLIMEFYKRTGQTKKYKQENIDALNWVIKKEIELRYELKKKSMTFKKNSAAIIVNAIKNDMHGKKKSQYVFSKKRVAAGYVVKEARGKKNG